MDRGLRQTALEQQILAVASEDLRDRTLVEHLHRRRDRADLTQIRKRQPHRSLRDPRLQPSRAPLRHEQRRALFGQLRSSHPLPLEPKAQSRQQPTTVKYRRRRITEAQQPALESSLPRRQRAPHPATTNPSSHLKPPDGSRKPKTEGISHNPAVAVASEPRRWRFSPACCAQLPLMPSLWATRSVAISCWPSW